MDTSKVWSIYLITNTVNGKMYVGQSSIGAAERWKKHLIQVKFGTKTYFYSAIRKYGSESFIVEQLAQVDTRDRADNLERVWIILLQTYNRKYGYNSTLGGEGVRSNDVIKEKLRQAFKGSGGPLYRHDIKDEDIRKFYLEDKLSTEQIAIKLSCGKTTVRNRLFFMGIPKRSGRQTWTDEQRQEVKKRLSQYIGKPRSLETRKKISVGMMGRVSPMLGKSHTPETKEKIRAFMKEYWQKDAASATN